MTIPDPHSDEGTEYNISLYEWGIQGQHPSQYLRIEDGNEEPLEKTSNPFDSISTGPSMSLVPFNA